MKTFLLSIVTILVLVVFGTCFLLAGQTIITLYNAKTIHSNRVETGCYIKGNYLHCNF